MFAAHGTASAGEADFNQGVQNLSAEVRQAKDAWQAQMRLFDAAESGDVTLAEHALQGGADINAALPNDYHGRTALMIASSKGDISMVIFLVSNRADVNKKGSIGSTALQFASGFGHYGTAKYLLDSKADVNAADKFGYTALHMAAFNNNADIVRLLLARGAKINAKTKDGQTPLALAKIRGHEEIVAILAAAGGRGDRQKTASALASEFERHIRAGDVLAAHRTLMAAPDAEFTAGIRAISGKAFAVYINRLYDTTKVPYLNGYQSFQLNAFVRKLYFDAGERLTDSVVLDKLKALSGQADADEAYGYLCWLLKNPNDLQTTP